VKARAVCGSRSHPSETRVPHFRPPQHPSMSAQPPRDEVGKRNRHRLITRGGCVSASRTEGRFEIGIPADQRGGSGCGVEGDPSPRRQEQVRQDLHRQLPLAADEGQGCRPRRAASHRPRPSFRPCSALSPDRFTSTMRFIFHSQCLGLLRFTAGFVRTRLHPLHRVRGVNRTEIGELLERARSRTARGFRGEDAVGLHFGRPRRRSATGRQAPGLAQPGSITRIVFHRPVRNRR
jgi:hypothetical protein